jgi:hypothetical protein
MFFSLNGSKQKKEECLHQHRQKTMINYIVNHRAHQFERFELVTRNVVGVFLEIKVNMTRKFLFS